MSQSSQPCEKWVVMKLGALGDMVLTSPFFEALRRKYPSVHLTLFTTPAFASLAREWGYFDEVWAEPRFRFSQPFEWFKVWRKLKQYDRIIDLQSVDRTYIYTCGFSVERVANDHDRHARLRLQELADKMGLGDLPSVNLPGSDIVIPVKKPFVILIPGASKLEKCWPQERFAELAEWLRKTYGINIMVIGLEPCIPELEVYKQKTSIHDIITYGRHACLSVGNDTGPQHLAAAGGCRTLTFYCGSNPPERCGIWGGWHLYRYNIHDLSLQEVQSMISQNAHVCFPEGSNTSC